LKVLIIGNGAREHALAWKVAQSPKIEKMYVAPGNAGTADIATNLDIPPTDIKELANQVNRFGIDLTIVGPEAPLASGIVDVFEQMQLRVFGPTKAAARLESSKVFAKELMQKYGIPCSEGRTFSDYSQATEYLDSQQTPVVIKADGLASGKGVTVANSKEEACKALSDAMQSRIFGSAGDKVIIEECLEGKEVSLLAFTDGNTIIPMIPACDYKRIFDDDQGPNTGGMGSYSPPGFFDAALTKQVMETIIEPAVKGMLKEGILYKGVIYAGLMVTPEGPKVLEFNARFGDPETQVILPRLKSDLVDIFLAITDNKLHEMNVVWSNDPCVGVVMASGGYPGSYKTGIPIEGLKNVDKDILVFHAGTRQDHNPQIVTDGGRVLTVAATGKTIDEARQKVYNNIPKIHFEGCQYRTDIAKREVD